LEAPSTATYSSTSSDLPGLRIDQMRPLAREVDEHLVAGAMHLAHRGRLRATVACVGLAELAVLVWTQSVAARAGCGRVLLPEQVHGHANSTHLAVDPGQIDRRSSGGLIPIELTKEPLLDLAVAEILDLIPQTGLLGASDVVADRRLAQPDRRRDLARGPAVLETHPQNLFDLSHRCSLRHRPSIARWGASRGRSSRPSTPLLLDRHVVGAPPGGGGRT